MPLKVPIVIWGDTPPSNHITCLAVCQNGCVVTGSLEGRLVLWHIRQPSPSRIEVSPHCLISGHPCSVLSVTTFHNEKLDIKSGVISLDESQEICLWNSETGCCLNYSSLKGRFTDLKTLQRNNNNVLRESLVLCSGFQTNMVVIDPFTLNVILILKGRLFDSLPKTIKSNCFTQSLDRLMGDKIFVVTVKGDLISWTVPFKILKTQTPVVVDAVVKSQKLENLGEILCVNIEPTLQYRLLFATRDSIHLYHYPEISPISSISVGSGRTVVSTEFISHRYFVAFFSDCGPALYLIDTDVSDKAPKSASIREIAQCPQTITGDFLGCKYCCRISLFSESECASVVMATPFGTIGLWKIGTFSNGTIDVIQNEDSVSPFVESCLESTWKAAKPTGFAKYLLSQQDLGNSQITCSHQLHEFGFMILGFKSGLITIAPALELVGRQIFGDTAGDDSNSRVFLRGHAGAVTALCYPFEENSYHNSCHLLSGGVDYTIRLWDIVCGVQLKCFHLHGGVIQEIFAVFGDSTSSMGMCVMSVASDYSVAVISLVHEKEILIARSHTSPVCSVKWRIKEDTVYVYCSDGTLFLWHVITGNLERCVTGKRALEILESVDDDPLAQLSDVQIGDMEFPVVVPLDAEGLSGSKRKHHSLFGEKGKHHSHGFGRHQHMHPHLPFNFHKKSGFKRVMRKISLKSHNPKINVSLSSKEDVADSTFNVSSTMNTGSSQNHLHASLSTSHVPLHSSACNLPTGSQSGCFTPHLPDDDHGSSYIASPPPFDLIPIRASFGNAYFHVLMIYADTLIAQLVSESRHDCENSSSGSKTLDTRSSISVRAGSSQTSLFSCCSAAGCVPVSSSARTLPLTVLKMGLRPTSDGRTYHKYYQYLQSYHTMLLQSTALLLISCLHPWSIDSEIDNVCLERLGLCVPQQSVTFGFVSQKRFFLMLPGWLPLGCASPKTQVNNDFVLLATEQDDSALEKSSPAGMVHKAEKYMVHWQVSGVMTTQHIVVMLTLTDVFHQVCGLSVSKLGLSHNTTSMRIDNLCPPTDEDANFQQTSGDLNVRQFTTTTSAPDLSRNNPMVRYEMTRKVGWKMLHLHHSCTTSNLTKENVFYQHPLLHELIFYWMDSCEVIQRSSFTILTYELCMMQPESRMSLVNSWITYLPSIDDLDRFDIEELMVFPTDSFMESGGFYGFWPSDKKYQQTLAVFLIAFVASQFSKEMDPLGKSVPGSPGGSVHSPLFVSTLQVVSHVMYKTILSPIALSKTSFYPIRRSVLFLLGNSFSLWQPHLNLSQVIMSMLDTTATLLVYLQGVGETNNKMVKAHHQGSPYYELFCSHRSCLNNIVSSHPETFVSLLNKEMTRLTSSSGYISIGQSALMSAFLFSHTRHHPIQVFHHPSLLQVMKNVAIGLIESLAGRAPDKFISIASMACELILHCTAHKLMGKDGSIMKVAPFLKKFNAVDYCEHSKRLVIGQTDGRFAVIDTRSIRVNHFDAHKNAITCLRFSPDGKNLVTYSYAEAKICLWHTHQSLFGLRGPLPKQANNYILRQQKTVSPGAVSGIFIEWDNNSTFRLIFDSDYELKYTL